MRRCSLCKHNLSLIPIRAFLSSQLSLQIPMANMVWFWGNCTGRGWVFLQRSLWFTVDSNRLTLLQGRVDFNARGWLLRNLTFCSHSHVGDDRTSHQCLCFPSSVFTSPAHLPKPSVSSNTVNQFPASNVSMASHSASHPHPSCRTL